MATIICDDCDIKSDLAVCWHCYEEKKKEIKRLEEEIENLEYKLLEAKGISQ